MEKRPILKTDVFFTVIKEDKVISWGNAVDPLTFISKTEV